MPYAVWIKPGGTEIDKYKIDGMPELPCGVAVKISEEQRAQAKHLHNVIVFEKVQDETVEEKEFVFEGKRYHIKDGVITPPMETEVWEKAKKKGLI